MTEEMPQVSHEKENSSEESDTLNWSSFRHLRNVDLAVRALTPHPWTIRRDPDPMKGYYIAGPPGTRVVAEGLTEEDASSLAFLVNELPEALEHFDDLAKLWEAISDADLNAGDSSEEPKLVGYLEVISNMQKRLAILEEGGYAPPPVATAGDLNYHHVGNVYEFEGFQTQNGPEPIVSVKHSGDFVVVESGYGRTTTSYLPKSLPVTVHLAPDMREFLDSIQKPELTETVPEEPNPVAESTGEEE